MDYAFSSFLAQYPRKYFRLKNRQTFTSFSAIQEDAERCFRNHNNGSRLIHLLLHYVEKEGSMDQQRYHCFQN